MFCPVFTSEFATPFSKNEAWISWKCFDSERNIRWHFVFPNLTQTSTQHWKLKVHNNIFYKDWTKTEPSGRIIASKVKYIFEIVTVFIFYCFHILLFSNLNVFISYCFHILLFSYLTVFIPYCFHILLFSYLTVFISYCFHILLFSYLIIFISYCFHILMFSYLTVFIS